VPFVPVVLPARQPSAATEPEAVHRFLVTFDRRAGVFELDPYAPDVR
jgi:hypothetical protein